MKIIIAGSRGITDLSIVSDAVAKSQFDIDEIVSGTARGVDKLGEQLAGMFDIPVKRFPADWDKFGKSAGYKRNAEMAEYADALVAVWDGESKGTKHMIDLANKAGLEVFIYEPEIE